jgi:DNA-3-methyladenine glycosylase II
MSTRSSFTIRPDAPFSLAAAAAFGFGPRTGRPRPAASEMRLAFVTDDMAHHACVHLAQDASSGVVTGTVETDGDPEAAWRQALRVVSLDHSGVAWAEAGRRDPVIGALQGEHEGLRPVLFHSPYEAAAWSIISARRYRSTAAVIRERICDELGRPFALGGAAPVSAFPLPGRLLQAESLPSISPQRVGWLHAVARAALDGTLDPARLAAMHPAEAMTRLCGLPGIGPAYATLILLRSTGVTDALTFSEPRLPQYVAHFYGLGAGPATRDQLAEIARGWRPFRTWAAVLLRVAGDRQGLPVAA